MTITLGELPADDESVVALVAEQLAEVTRRYGGDEDDPPVDPAARFLVARRDGAALGCVAVQPLEPGVGEIKRLYVVPGERRRGVSRLLMAGAEELARRSGLAGLRLETGDAQPEAVALYASSGWRRIPSYGHWKDSPRSICFEKRLDS